MSAPDPGIISGRLAVMHDLLGYLDRLGDVDGDALRAEIGRRLAVERALCGLVDQAVDINAHLVARTLGRAPQTHRESFELAARTPYLPSEVAAALLPSVGLRNVLGHDYVSADLDLVADAIPLARRDYRRYVRAVARALTGDGTASGA